MGGTLVDTYVAALRHGTADVPAGAVRLGVVRRPTPWFHAAVDENVPALAPPSDLLDAAKARQAQLEDRGLDDATAHNRAMEDVDFESRYLAHLEDVAEAREAVAALWDRLAAGEDIALVCYENTEHKRCHRTLLRSVIEEARGQ